MLKTVTARSDGLHRFLTNKKELSSLHVLIYCINKMLIILLIRIRLQHQTFSSRNDAYATDRRPTANLYLQICFVEG